MKNRKSTTLYCFSPPVMIATMLIELSLAVFAFIKFKKSPIKILAIITLILLAAFQAAEFMVCQAYAGINGEIVSRIGFIAITFLPPLGIHIANTIAGRRRNWSTVTSYVLAAGFVGYFLLAPNTFNDYICSGNYVIFHLNSSASLAYEIYYLSLLLGILALATYLAIIQKSKSKRSALAWLNIGALSFLVPTAIAYWFVDGAANAIPSIMCGFAILYAIILTTRVVPLATAKK
jgi:hypothetical protein